MNLFTATRTELFHAVKQILALGMLLAAHHHHVHSHQHDIESVTRKTAEVLTLDMVTRRATLSL